jgi:predicted DNA-binding protein with PD1-like motif
MSEIKAYSAVGRAGRILAARLLPGQDVVEGIIGLVKEKNLRSGTITAIGSLRSAAVVYPNSMEFGDNPMDVAVLYKMEGPVELGIGQGVFGRDEGGEVGMHFHGVIMDQNGNMRAGNLVPGSAPVLATVDLTIQEFEGLEIKPTLDPAWKNKFLHPVEK